MAVFRPVTVINVNIKHGMRDGHFLIALKQLSVPVDTRCRTFYGFYA